MRKNRTLVDQNMLMRITFKYCKYAVENHTQERKSAAENQFRLRLQDGMNLRRTDRKCMQGSPKDARMVEPAGSTHRDPQAPPYLHQTSTTCDLVQSLQMPDFQSLPSNDIAGNHLSERWHSACDCCDATSVRQNSGRAVSAWWLIKNRPLAMNAEPPHQAAK